MFGGEGVAEHREFHGSDAPALDDFRNSLRQDRSMAVGKPVLLTVSCRPFATRQVISGPASSFQQVGSGLLLPVAFSAPPLRSRHR
jgi:hypothetical protein